MTRIYVDSEFIEDGSTIEPLSLGAVTDDHQAFYAVFTDTNRARASEWVAENVIPHLDGPTDPDVFDVRCDRGGIAAAFKAWVRLVCGEGEQPEFWADYGAYDWVLICQLYGPMVDLPEGWPMFVRDVQQIRPPGKKLIERENPHNALADAGDVRYRVRVCEAANARELFGD